MAASPASPSTPAPSPRSGIYDLAIHHDQILVPVVMRHWDVEHLTGLDDEAERARDRLLARMAKSEHVARRVADRKRELVPA